MEYLILSAIFVFNLLPKFDISVTISVTKYNNLIIKQINIEQDSITQENSS